MTKPSSKLSTLAIHAGTPPDPITGARTAPINQSTSFVFKDTDHAAALFHLEEEGYIYSRLTNPTLSALEERLTALEGGIGATVAPAGLSAQMLCFTALMQPGDHIVASDRLYGGSRNQLENTFPRTFGWQTDFADHSKPDEFQALIKDNTKAIFVETLANPGGWITDLEAVAKIAEDANIPLIADNTMATPVLCRPLEFGANIVTYSTTKFLNGHGNAMGGAVIDGGSFDWTKTGDKFPALTAPQPSFQGNSYADKFGHKALVIHNHAVGLRDLGLNQQPMNAYLTLMGLETLSLRIPKHSENALIVAEHLENHDKSSWVNFAALKSSPYFDLAQKYMNGCGGAVFTFGIKGGYDAGVKFVNALEMFSHVAHIGDTRSMVIHPASTTHSQLSPEAREKAGVGDDVVRLSIGLEDIDDILGDINQALDQI